MEDLPNDQLSVYVPMGIAGPFIVILPNDVLRGNILSSITIILEVPSICLSLEGTIFNVYVVTDSNCSIVLKLLI